MAQFSISTRIFWGTSGTAEAQEMASSLGIMKIIFIVDKNLQSAPAVDALIEQYKSKKFGIEKISYLEVAHEPSYNDLDRLTAGFRGVSGDAIIAIGGGSVMDIAKGIGVLLKNPGQGIEYRGMNKVKNPGIPVICYPTTAGTGSEVTHTASFIDTNSNTKLGINGRHVAPIFGVLHPELTFSCPPKTTIFSGLDAMVHSLEAVSAKTANDLSITLGAKGFSLLFRYFEDVLKEPKSYFAREQMLLGSYYAGLAMMNVGGGPASGISYPLGVHFKVPHGIAGGIFLPHVIKFNTEHGYDGYEAIYNLLPQANLSLSARDKARDFSEKFSQFYGRLQAPMVLDAYGIAKKDIPLLTKLTMEQRSANLTLNPTPFTEKDVVQILEKVIS